MTDIGPSRCFWTTLRHAPPEVERRVFVALCDGAWDTGRPQDCTCDSWPARVADLQRQVGAERRRAVVAEEAAGRAKARVAQERRELHRWRQRQLELLERRWVELEEAGGRRPPLAFTP